MIGPVAHVLHAHKLLAGIHAEKREATITAVLDASMLGALDVRRADTGGNVLKRPKSFDVRVDFRCISEFCDTRWIGDG